VPSRSRRAGRACRPRRSPGVSKPGRTFRAATAHRMWPGHRAKSGLGLGFGPCNRDLARRGPCTRRAVRRRRGRSTRGPGCVAGRCRTIASCCGMPAVNRHCSRGRAAGRQRRGFGAPARIWRAGPGSSAPARIWRRARPGVLVPPGRATVPCDPRRQLVDFARAGAGAAEPGRGRAGARQPADPLAVLERGPTGRTYPDLRDTLSASQNRVSVVRSSAKPPFDTVRRVRRHRVRRHRVRRHRVRRHRVRRHRVRRHRASRHRASRRSGRRAARRRPAPAGSRPARSEGRRRRRQRRARRGGLVRGLDLPADP
jgi:hypothetical protein